MNNLNVYLNILSLISISVVGYLAAKSKIKSENYNDLKERVAILEKDREYAREQHIVNQKSIAHLEGQLKTYKDIPLQRIDQSLHLLTKSNASILETLKSSAKIMKHEADTGGMLVKNKGSAPLEIVEVNK